MIDKKPEPLGQETDPWLSGADPWSTQIRPGLQAAAAAGSGPVQEQQSGLRARKPVEGYGQPGGTMFGGDGRGTGGHYLIPDGPTPSVPQPAVSSFSPNAPAFTPGERW